LRIKSIWRKATEPCSIENFPAEGKVEGDGIKKALPRIRMEGRMGEVWRMLIGSTRSLYDPNP
jgi:hypothetical protein